MSRFVVADLVGWRNPRSGKFQSVSERAKERLAKMTRSILKDAEATAKQESPVGKRRDQKDARPRFSESWRSHVEKNDKGATGVLQNVAPHADFVIFPTKPHVIVPKRAKRLRFVNSSGQVVFAKKVNHPGTKGNDVPSRVLEKMGPVFERELAGVTRDVVTFVHDVFN